MLYACQATAAFRSKRFDACLAFAARALDIARASPEPLDGNNGRDIAADSLAGLTVKEPLTTMRW